MNLTLRGPALVDDSVLPDVLVHVEGERIAAVTPLVAAAIASDTKATWSAPTSASRRRATAT